MSGELISGNRYSDHSFSDLRLSKIKLEASSFYECRFVDCSFTESVFHDCRFAGCSFINSDLSLIKVPLCAFSRVQFESSRLIGIDWTQADWRATSLGEPVRFTRCTINHSTFIGVNLSKILIRDTSAQNVDFREADLSGADLSGTDLSDSLFSNTNLSGADLTSAKNYTISPETNKLKGTKFSLPEAMALLFNMDIDLVDMGS
ncbi:MAG TPA: pentapeptide repeat-containing protein [candidate division Zixibacteria bacterium]|nr:pentapeptide repeat-containing protein [candidate division Zixibacteria bacterium]